MSDPAEILAAVMLSPMSTGAAFSDSKPLAGKLSMVIFCRV